jgi:hypothetical protein
MELLRPAVICPDACMDPQYLAIAGVPPSASAA